MRVPELKALARERGLRGYSRLRKAEIIELIRNNQQRASWAPEAPALNRPTRPPKPKRPPPPPPIGVAPFAPKKVGEELKTDLKKLKRMKRKLADLNRKIRHSKKKRDGLIHKRNSLRKGIEDIKVGINPPKVKELEWKFREGAFNGDYRSFRANGRPKMDAETFFAQIRGKIIEMIGREIGDRNSAKVQTSTWIRFVRDGKPQDRVELAFNSRMISVFRSIDLDQVVDGMIAHMMEQIENPALINSRFRFDQVLFQDISFY